MSVRQSRMTLAAVIGVAIVALIAAVAILSAGNIGEAAHQSHEHRPGSHSARSNVTSGRGLLPINPGSYIGLYAPKVPASYSSLTSFTEATGVQPNLDLYYSGWPEPFAMSFAGQAFRHGSVPLVQLCPTGIKLSAIAAGEYDAYLEAFAESVRSYHHPVVIGFGHEVNGRWYSWGFTHTPAAMFVATWRHIVDVFRAAGARNVVWLWTINTVDLQHNAIPAPAAWWPGSSYVNWVGIDGYFHKASAQFSSVFGPTIIDVRELTKDPILISETGASPATGQAGKIASLFSGVRAYGLLGFVWFDGIGNADYRINSRASFAAIRHGAKSDGPR